MNGGVQGLILKSFQPHLLELKYDEQSTFEIAFIDLVLCKLLRILRWKQEA